MKDTLFPGWIGQTLIMIQISLISYIFFIWTHRIEALENKIDILAQKIDVHVYRQSGIYLDPAPPSVKIERGQSAMSSQKKN